MTRFPRGGRTALRRASRRGHAGDAPGLALGGPALAAASAAPSGATIDHAQPGDGTVQLLVSVPSSDVDPEGVEVTIGGTSVEARATPASEDSQVRRTLRARHRHQPEHARCPHRGARAAASRYLASVPADVEVGLVHLRRRRHRGRGADARPRGRQERPRQPRAAARDRAYDGSPARCRRPARGRRRRPALGAGALRRPGHDLDAPLRHAAPGRGVRRAARRDLAAAAGSGRTAAAAAGRGGARHGARRHPPRGARRRLRGAGTGARPPGRGDRRRARGRRHQRRTSRGAATPTARSPRGAPARAHRRSRGRRGGGRRHDVVGRPGPVTPSVEVSGWSPTARSRPSASACSAGWSRWAWCARVPTGTTSSPAAGGLRRLRGHGLGAGRPRAGVRDPRQQAKDAAEKVLAGQAGLEARIATRLEAPASRSSPPSGCSPTRAWRSPPGPGTAAGRRQPRAARARPGPRRRGPVGLPR